MRRTAQQVIAPKRETATFLKALSLKFNLIATGFALVELRRLPGFEIIG
jgi:hypothetical protein